MSCVNVARQGLTSLPKTVSISPQCTQMLNSQISIITRSIIIRWQVHLGKASEALWGDMMRKSFLCAVTCHNDNTHTEKDWGKRRVQRSKPLAGESINSTHIRSCVDTHTFGSEVLLNPQHHHWQYYDRSGERHRSRRQAERWVKEKVSSKGWRR